jgi:predicted Zn-dependent protease
MMTPDQARALARKVVSLTHADEAEALVVAEKSALTRFANNRINQNVCESDALVNVRAVLGTRVGVARTNRLDNESLAACCDAAVAAARVAPEDPDFPGLPEPEPVREAERSSTAAKHFDATARADSVHAIIEPSVRRGYTAAGKVRTGTQVVAVANSRGIDVGMEVTGVQATVLSMGETGSGWSSYLGKGPEGLDAAAMGEHAASVAERSANPEDLEPGTYQVVLAPDAVADIMDFLGFMGFSGKAYEEGRSFMSNMLEDQVMSPYVNIYDDAVSDHAMGLLFDYEGAPKMRIPLIEEGVALRPVTDSYWSAKSGFINSGHALPAPNSYGPLPLNLEMAAGDATIEELISRVDRGVYVTRFHYVNVEDPIPVTLTGMTRDGTFLIENGKLTRPLKNLRFTQSAVEALEGLEALTFERKHVGTEEGASLVPGVLLSAFNFTGQTS